MSAPLKPLQGTFNWLLGSLNLILMPHILPISANETIGEGIKRDRKSDKDTT